MTRLELVEALRTSRGLPRSAAEEVVDTIFGSVEEALIEGGRVELRGFGTFSTRTAAAYSTRHPVTGDPIAVPPLRVVVFKPGRALREAASRSRAQEEEA